MNPIYLDYNATTPIDPEVAAAMKPYLEEYFGNPSSIHSYGVKSRLAVEKARAQVAGLLHCEPSEVVFTSGGTESNNWAIKGVALANKKKGNHIITSSVEHPAVFEVCRYLEGNGFQVTYLPVDEYGRVSVEEVEKALRPETILITIMHANNEVGTIQPIEEIAALAKKHDLIFHTDAAQSAGKISVDVSALGVDLLSLAGHKLYAPKGIGALYIRSGVVLEKLIHGADHEQNLRAGTENVLEIVGLGKACELASAKLEEYAALYRQNQDLLYARLKESMPGLRRNGHPDYCLPNTLSVSFRKVEANTLVSRLEGVAASAGAACHAGSVDLSAVLEAMAIPMDYAMGTLRFSTGRENTAEQIEQAAKEIIQTAKILMPKEGEEETVAAKPLHSEVKLTHYTHGLGCACKIEPRKLEAVLQSLQPFTDPRVLVGTETSDDATVYHINEETAIVQTLDFFTPIVDDAWDFGAIAAANALSDIYAMGAKPLFALNIVGFPEEALPMEILQQILKGAQDKAHEAGIGVWGGHTIEDPEPKYGMVVTGSVHPQKIWKNSGAKAGDVLVLTKLLGTGILTTALKRGMVGDDLRIRLTAQMSELNRAAAEALDGFDVHACTDVTGFGLLGHLKEMSLGSGCDAEIEFEKLPFLPEVKSLATAGVIPGGTYRNLEYVQEVVDFGKHPRINQLLLCDAQTSGGLLIALPEAQAGEYVDKMKDKAWCIGRFTAAGEGRIQVK